MARHTDLMLRKNRAYLELYTTEIRIARAANCGSVPDDLLAQRDRLAQAYERACSALAFRKAGRWAYVDPRPDDWSDDDGIWVEAGTLPDQGDDPDLDPELEAEDPTADNVS